MLSLSGNTYNYTSIVILVVPAIYVYIKTILFIIISFFCIYSNSSKQQTKYT